MMLARAWTMAAEAGVCCRLTRNCGNNDNVFVSNGRSVIGLRRHMSYNNNNNSNHESGSTNGES